ncbi:hypothetical protein IWX46DRAFT_592316, partial [Phyllosticta citricarpa]
MIPPVRFLHSSWSAVGSVDALLGVLKGSHLFPILSYHVGFDAFEAGTFFMGLIAGWEKHGRESCGILIYWNGNKGLVAAIFFFFFFFRVLSFASDSCHAPPENHIGNIFPSPFHPISLKGRSS